MDRATVVCTPVVTDDQAHAILSDSTGSAPDETSPKDEGDGEPRIGSPDVVEDVVPCGEDGKDGTEDDDAAEGEVDDGTGASDEKDDEKYSTESGTYVCDEGEGFFILTFELMGGDKDEEYARLLLIHPYDGGTKVHGRWHDLASGKCHVLCSSASEVALQHYACKYVTCDCRIRPVVDRDTMRSLGPRRTIPEHGTSDELETPSSKWWNRLW